MKERTKDNPPSSNDGIYFDNEVAEKEGGFFRKGKIMFIYSIVVCRLGSSFQYVKSCYFGICRNMRIFAIIPSCSRNTLHVK